MGVGASLDNDRLDEGATRVMDDNAYTEKPATGAHLYLERTPS